MRLPRRTRTEPTKLRPVDKAMQTEHEEVARVLNGNVSFGIAGKADNVSGAWASIADTGAANTDFTLTHNLDRIPEGWLVVNVNLATEIYKGGAPWTETTITLKSSTAHVALTVFVI